MKIQMKVTHQKKVYPYFLKIALLKLIISCCQESFKYVWNPELGVPAFSALALLS
jgi:hypothetical protein